MQLVASYNSLDTQHFARKGEPLTLCGRNRENWILLREAESADIESAWTCARCSKKMEGQNL